MSFIDMAALGVTIALAAAWLVVTAVTSKRPGYGPSRTGADLRKRGLK